MYTDVPVAEKVEARQKSVYNNFEGLCFGGAGRELTRPLSRYVLYNSYTDDAFSI